MELGRNPELDDVRWPARPAPPAVAAKAGGVREFWNDLPYESPLTRVQYLYSNKFVGLLETHEARDSLASTPICTAVCEIR